MKCVAGRALCVALALPLGFVAEVSAAGKPLLNGEWTVPTAQPVAN
jgi:hypothetical protein